MQLLNLIGLCVILILTSYSKSQTWEIHVNRTITARYGSSVIINCMFKYPPKQKTDNFEVYWKTEGTSHCSMNSNDKKAFISHPNETCVISKYKGKTSLIGDTSKGNCSLRIESFMDTELKIYLRVGGFNDCYSFVKESVYISQNDSPNPLTLQPDLQNSLMTTFEPKTSTSTNDHQRPPILYLVIPIPLAALLIIVVTGIIICAKHKRSQTFTREESGYYVNFSRASSNPPKSESPSKTLDILHPEPKVIDEPVYINTQASTNPMSQRIDHSDNIYGNVDYSE